jgi:FlaA1/EpsC-like NDP-sugar epimerase
MLKKSKSEHKLENFAQIILLIVLFLIIYIFILFYLYSDIFQYAILNMFDRHINNLYYNTIIFLLFSFNFFIFVSLLTFHFSFHLDILISDYINKKQIFLLISLFFTLCLLII